MARNRHKVYGRQKFDAFLMGLKWNEHARRAWDSVRVDRGKNVELFPSTRQCSKHPEVKLRRAGFLILCEDGDSRRCFDTMEAHKGLCGCRSCDCSHWGYIVDEYVQACKDAHHVLGIRVYPFEECGRLGRKDEEY